MDQLDKLAEQVLTGQISIDDLVEEQQDAVIMRTYEIAVELSNDEVNGEAFRTMADTLEPLYQDILSEGSDEFGKAIEDAEERGSTYFRPELCVLH